MTKASAKQRRKLKARAMAASSSAAPASPPGMRTRSSTQDGTLNAPATMTSSSKPDGKLEAVAKTTSSSKLKGKLEVPAMMTNSSQRDGELEAPRMTANSSKKEGKSKLKGKLEVPAMTMNSSQRDGELQAPPMTANSSKKERKSKLKGKLKAPAMTTNSSQRDGELQAPRMTANSSKKERKSKLNAPAMPTSSSEQKGNSTLQTQATTAKSSTLQQKEKGKQKEEVITPTGINDLPDELITAILLRVPVEDKESITLVCSRWYELDRDFTAEITVGSGLVPPQEALAGIVHRYYNLETLKIVYMMHEMMEQVDDESLYCLSERLWNLTDVSLIGCSNVTDVGIGNIALCMNLRAVRLQAVQRVTERGLLWLVSGCAHTLEILEISQLHAVRDYGWLKFIGAQGHVKSLAIEECRETMEPWLYTLGPRGWGNLESFSFSSYGQHSRQELENWTFNGPAGTEYSPNLGVLTLSHCVARTGTGVFWILGHCKALRRVEIFDCAGVKDDEMRVITKNNPQLSSIFVGSQCASAPNLTNGMLVAIGENCPRLENLKLVCRTGQIGSESLEPGLVTIIRRCTQLKAVSLGSFSGLGRRTMAALRTSTSLEDLEFAACDDLPNGMILCLGPKVTRLSLLYCSSLTDKCLSGYGAYRPALPYLQIYCIPSITKEAALSAATVLRYWYNDHHGRFDAVLKGTDSMSDPAAEDFFVQRSLCL